MKKLVLVLVALTGCGGSPTEPRHIAEAEARCAQNGGVRTLEPHWMWADYVKIHCNNGASFNTKAEAEKR